MPETILLDVQTGTLPEGFCPSGPTALQQYYDTMFNLAQWSLPVSTRFYNFGDTAPEPEFRVYPWFRTISGYPDRWYVYIGGKWLAPHPIPAGPNGFRVDWTGSEDDLVTFDGGANEVITLTTGPFWQIDTDFAGRIAMAPGAIPSANPAKTLSVEENYGEGAHTMTGNEVGTHTHVLTSQASINRGDGTIEVVNSGAGATDGLLVGLTGDATTPLAVGAPSYTADQEAMPIIPPVRGAYKIKRSIRQFYTAT